MKNKKVEIVNLDDYSPGETNSYTLDWFMILKYHKTKFVIYGEGQWYYHLMDWSGMNMYHGRLPNSPVFNSMNSAIEWLTFQVQNKAYRDGMELSGHHAGRDECLKGCGDRTVIGQLGFSTLAEISKTKKRDGER